MLYNVTHGGEIVPITYMQVVRFTPLRIIILSEDDIISRRKWLIITVPGSRNYFTSRRNYTQISYFKF